MRRCLPLHALDESASQNQTVPEAAPPDSSAAERFQLLREDPPLLASPPHRPAAEQSRQTTAPRRPRTGLAASALAPTRAAPPDHRALSRARRPDSGAQPHRTRSHLPLPPACRIKPDCSHCSTTRPQRRSAVSIVYPVLSTRCLRSCQRSPNGPSPAALARCVRLANLATTASTTALHLSLLVFAVNSPAARQDTMSSPDPLPRIPPKAHGCGENRVVIVPLSSALPRTAAANAAAGRALLKEMA